MVRTGPPTSRPILTALFLVVLVAATCHANPRGGTVVGGSGTIDQSNPALTQITQSTDKAIINWQSFGNCANETIRFVQPTPLSATLNRVTSLDPSIIQGALQSNGRIFLLNPNGIVFGPTSRVNVGGLVASTLSMGDRDFMSGQYSLSQDPQRERRAVVNQGCITTSHGGAVVLAAPLVDNEGTIEALQGRVALGAGTQAVVDLDGQGLVGIAVPGGPAGDVAVDPGSCSEVLRQVVNTSGIVQAGAVEERDGKVILRGAEGVALNNGTVSLIADRASGALAFLPYGLLVESPFTFVEDGTIALEQEWIGLAPDLYDGPAIVEEEKPVDERYRKKGFRIADRLTISGQID